MFENLIKSLILIWLKRFHAAVILDVSSRHGTPASSDGGDDVVNFADVFQGEDLGVENLVFEGEDGNDEVEDKNGVIEDEE